jgi:sigma-B regulation protein RsbU (phosphoserine phosphatase)
LAWLDQAGGLPLGVIPRLDYPDATHQLLPGDELVLYTDGITEALNSKGEQFGLGRLDKVLENCLIGASDILHSVLDAIDLFTEGQPAHDDQTLLVAKIS